YLVTENRYEVLQLQPGNDTHHGVYLPSRVDGLSYHYERQPTDPRISHEITLQVDTFGNVTDKVTLAYPRRVPQHAEQAEPRILYTHTDVANKDDDAGFYRGVAFQLRTYEVTGLGWAAGQAAFTRSAFQSILDPSAAVGAHRPYEWQRPAGLTTLEKRIVEWTRSYFRSDTSAAAADITLDASGLPARSLANRLPLGQIESLALPYEEYRAALTPGLLDKLYPGPAAGQPLVKAEMLRDGGYHLEDGIWWIPTGQQTFLAQTFYLPHIARTPFASETQTGYDDYGLLVARVVDAAGNETAVEAHDYRVLQPQRVRDANKTVSEVAFDALGLVVATATRDDSGAGDSVAGLVLEPSALAPADAVGQARSLLGNASRRIFYNMHHYAGSRQPNFVQTIAREVHASEAGGGTGRLQQSLLHSDGFGREVQTKVLVEPGDVNGAPVSQRWLSTGTTVYNNKGKPVQKFEPFFSAAPAFGLESHGVSSTLFYDPMERMVVTLHPNHTYEKVVFDAWRQETWDLNDTIHPTQRWDPRSPNVLPDPGWDPAADPDAGHFSAALPPETYRPTWYGLRMDPAAALLRWPDSDGQGNPLPQNAQVRAAERRAAERAARHAATPAIEHLDVLGRAVITVADNGLDAQGNDELLTTRVELDVEGNDRAITDPRGFEALVHGFDLAGRKPRVDSADAGLRLTLPDIEDRPCHIWDANGNETYLRYDGLRRLEERWVRPKGSADYRLAEKTVYGEQQGGSPEQTHHRGRVWRIYDGAGLAENVRFDFKGNLEETKRTLLADGTARMEWAKS
ncbi:MAG TPA: toxin TcdB middle/C-terminal domain-containing protein, partial [Anaerolineae bacterium]|nr:toxin TcdB middle/C-terminal domain-containing protein [Anaerolineae bacterium]